MEQPYISPVVASFKPETNKALETLCAKCTASMWRAFENSRGSGAICFCTKLHAETWHWDGSKSTIAKCDGFTDQPPKEE